MEDVAAAAALCGEAKEKWKWCMEAQHREEDAVARESTLPAAEIISFPPCEDSDRLVVESLPRAYSLGHSFFASLVFVLEQVFGRST